MGNRDEREEGRKVDTIERAMGPRNEYAEPRALTDEDLVEVAFKYHPPVTVAETNAYASIRAAGKTLALVILQSVPKCADRTAAIRKVREAVMTANAGVALHGLI